MLQLARGDTKAQAAFDARTNRILALIPGGPANTVQLIIRIEDPVSAFAVAKHLRDMRPRAVATLRVDLVCVLAGHILVAELPIHQVIRAVVVAVVD